MALSLTGCTHEGPHTGCDEGSLNLLFTYDGNTVGFDQTIAEDIELYLYDGQGKKMDERHIPYENIKGGSLTLLSCPIREMPILWHGH